MRVFKNEVLRKIFGPKTDRGDRGVEKNAEDNYGLYFSPINIRVIKSRSMCWAGHAALMGDRRDAYRVLVRQPEGRKQLGIPRRRWENNNRMNVQEVGCGGMDLNDLALDTDRWRAVVNAVMNLHVP